jgi:DNA helicase-2/ATP-dependent DNA helicase PcrA
LTLKILILKILTFPSKDIILLSVEHLKKCVKGYGYKMVDNNKRSILDTLVLNDVQRAAVAYIDGPELVFAGAGTGKTRVLTAKIAYLIDCGYRPYQIFAATFTNKAAGEMRERVEKFVSAPVSGLWIGTFHSLCAKMLRREAASVGYPPGFTIYSNSDQLSLIKKVMAALGIDEKAMPPKSLLASISSRKSACLTPSECEASAAGMWEREVARAYAVYQKALRERQAMDFDDLINNAVYMFRADGRLLEKYREQFRYVLVDEYQDTNTAQFQLISLLSKGHGKIFAVGDDDQSIYGWRGAKIENILSFEKEFPNTKVFKLEENYRSTISILKFANAAVKCNLVRAQKELWTGGAAGAPVKVSRFRDDRQEAEYVAGECEKLTRKISGTEIAVLFRTNAQSRAFEESFIKMRIPYVLVGGTGFYERAEIKDCMAYLRLLVNDKDDVSFERIANTPPRGLGDKAMEALEAFAKENGVSLLQAVASGRAESLNTRSRSGFADLRELYALLGGRVEAGAPLTEVLRVLLRESGYMDMLTERAAQSEEEAARVENVNELMGAMDTWQKGGGGDSLSDFLEEVSLAGDVDGWNRAENAVNFMTLHSAKGLEFKAVFLVGVEDGILPSRQVLHDASKVEEERRLFYVGGTRAMDTLECCYAERRFRFGSIQPSEPSRFLSDVPSELYEFHNRAVWAPSWPPDSAAGKTPFGYAAKTPVNTVTAAREPGNKAGKVSIDSDKPGSYGYNEYSQEDEPRYRMGQTVTHKTYGKGKIVSISGFGPDTKLTVLFNDGARKKLLARFAKLDV